MVVGIGFVLFTAALLTIVIVREVRGRRRMFEAFEEAVLKDGVEITSLEFSEDTPRSSVFVIKGRIGARPFTFRAEDRVRGGGSSWFTLNIYEPVPLRSGVCGFGGDARHSKSDQSRLSRLFGQLWPVGRYPRPARP